MQPIRRFGFEESILDKNRRLVRNSYVYEDFLLPPANIETCREEVQNQVIDVARFVFELKAGLR